MAQTFADANPPEPNEIYNGREWLEKRGEYESYWNIYDGAEWKESTGAFDPDTADVVLRYPLQINPPAKACRIHRAVMFGMRDDVPMLPVRSAVVDGQSTEAQEIYQNFINSTWFWSDGIASMEESGLLLQIYGGTVFKAAWEPWNMSLPHRIAIRLLKSPGWCLPIYNIYDPWDLLEAWIGYKIPADVARKMYGVPVDEDDEKVLYLEHWTKDSWEIKVNDRVPVMEYDNQTYKLSDENPWGVVPVVYIPHERDGGFYGRSLVDGLVGLSRELNAREADIGEAVKEQTHRKLVGKNLRTQGGSVLRMLRMLDSDNRFIDEVIDIGEKRPLQHSGDPDLSALSNPDMPATVAGFPDTLWDEIRRQGDIASVAMGDDDVSGGRITGPVTAYRMWPTISHTMTERAFFSTGLSHIARIIATMAREREASGAYKDIGVNPPGITEEMKAMALRQSWFPMIPIERLQKEEMLNARLVAGGVSLNSYLTQVGEEHVEEEEARIWADRERMMQLEAKVKESGNGSKQS